MIVLIEDRALAIAIPIFSVRCHYCSGWANKHELVTIGAAAKMCWKCWERHLEALSMLKGDRLWSCGGCKLSVQELNEQSTRPYISMWVVFKDGIYQVLCTPCRLGYEQKRKDLFKGTPYGDKIKLR